MKKRVGLFAGLLLCLTLLVGCNNTPTPSNYYINDLGNLVMVLEDGTENDLGEWGDEIIKSLENVTISDDGFYVINGFKTDINAKLPVSYFLDDDGNLTVKYNDNSSENLGNLGNSIINGVNSITISNDGYYIINGIKTTIVAVESYTVSFDTGFSASVPSEKVKDGYKVEKPNVSRTGYTLDGWFCNGEEWRFNSDVVKNDMILKAEWTANTYTVSFINEKGTNPESMTIIYDSDYVLPTVEPISGYTFAGWYYNNTKVDSSKWDIADNITLNARWERDTYVISFDTDGGTTVNSMTVYSYSTIDSLPTTTKADYEFLGWYLGNDQVTLPYEFTEGNKTFKAHWKGINEKFEFDIDDAGTGIKIISYKLNDENVVIPDTIAGKNVTTIATGAFKDKTNLKVIDLGNNVTNFEYKCFENCNSLEEIKIIGDAVTTLTYMFGTSSNIPSSLEIITFKENSKTFGKNLFNGAEGHLFTVYVNSTIKIAPKDAFYECDSIKEIYFSDTITRFENRVVCGCSNLQYVKLPSNLQSVGMNNFMNCAIKYIIFPKSLTSADYGGLCSSGIILVESETRPSGWSSSAFSIYENEKPIFYGFKSLHKTDDFLYALCQVGSTKQCVIIEKYTSVSYPEMIDGYPVTYPAR